MGMRIGGASSAGAGQGTGAANWQQNQQNFKSLASALSSGDLASAQKAYASLTANNNNIPSNSPLAQIGKALQSGDVGAAQQAMQSLQAARGGHHHHHGGGQTAAAGSSGSSTTPSTSAVGPGSLIDTTS